MIKLILLTLFLLLISCKNTKLSLRNINHERNKGSVEKIDINSTKIIYGKSSFYAHKYHGRLTANGEVYDMNKLTCAHKSLPFNTKLKVTYLKTNLSVFVRVNDRGPFIEGRILDLSLEAAKQIGLFNDGVGEIKIEIL